MNVFAMNAQTFKGKIFSSIDSTPVFNVYIFSSKTILIAQSKSDGSFEIPNQPHKIILFKHYLYEDTEILFDSLPNNIYINSKDIGLNEVVVSAGKREQKLNETTVSIDILKPKQVH